uniref:Uncharacterized protein n=1 Tax=Oryza brachyantha TaxID=4533 RepID=J3N4I9_ORYBR
MGCDDKCGCAVPCPGGAGCRCESARSGGGDDVLVRRPLRVQPVHVRPRVAAGRERDGQPEGRLLLRGDLHLRLLRRLHHHHHLNASWSINPCSQTKGKNRRRGRRGIGDFLTAGSEATDGGDALRAALGVRGWGVSLRGGAPLRGPARVQAQRVIQVGVRRRF